MKIARHGTAYHVETLVRKYRRVQRQCEVETANAIHVTRELTHYWDEDGSLVIHGRLPAEQGALMLKVLEMQMEKQFHEVQASLVNIEAHWLRLHRNSRAGERYRGTSFDWATIPAGPLRHPARLAAS